MIQIRQAVIVEGKYDKIKVSNLLDTIVIETEGFGIFKDKAKQKLIRRLARERGILILTDSDAAGFTIRHFLSGIVPPETVTHVYIPDVFGKERRKAAPSKEGKLGVEGVKAELILQALQKAGVTATVDDGPLEQARRLVTKTDLFEDGLNGTADSAKKRKLLLKQLDLPQRMSANAMLKLINTFMTFSDYKAAVRELDANNKDAYKTEGLR